MRDRTTKRRSRKSKADRPKKPKKDFPLTPHPAGYWCKSINGKLHYFKRWGRIVNGKMVRLPDDGWPAASRSTSRTRTTCTLVGRHAGTRMA